MKEHREPHNRKTDSALLTFALVWEFLKTIVTDVGQALFPPPKVEARLSRSPSPEDKRSLHRHEPASGPKAQRCWATFAVACSFVISAAAGVWFLVVYWTTASHVLLGATFAVFSGGIGVCLILYARGLMRDAQAHEPREVLISSDAERALLAHDFRQGADEIQRRGLLVWIVLSAAGFLAAIVVSLFRSLGGNPAKILLSRLWTRGQRLVDSDGRIISINTLEPGSTVVVFPENDVGNERAQTVLVRVDERLLGQVPPRRAGWSPMGYFAYSRVCTHAGCPVGLFERTTGLLMCPCHQSTFDVLRGAQPTSGPAARPLPQLPLYVDNDGMLRAAGGFTAPPGPGFWGMPPSPPPEES